MDFASLGSLENVVEFELHFLQGRGAPHPEDSRRELLGQALLYAKDYIWQNENFNLRRGPAPWHRKKAAGQIIQTAVPDSALWGSVHFGDNIEDEWFIVWMLLSFCAGGSQRAVRIWDNDGEFLLIEAALHLPKWLKPDVAANRVWLYEGAVHILPLPSSTCPGLPATPSTAEALQLLQSPHVATLAGPAIQAAISARLAGYPGKVQASWHHARCLVPARVAHALCRQPQLVAPAVQAFYHRTPADMRAAGRAKHLPPQDMVSITVRFSKCLYAQLSQQTCQPPRAYPPLPPSKSPEHRPARLGMMLTLGLEVLALSAEPPAPTSSALPGPSPASTPAHRSGWPAFLASLQRNGYFGEDIPGSMRHKQRLAAAQASFAGMAEDAAPLHSKAGCAQQLHELLAEPFDCEEVAEAMQEEEDSEAWMAEGQAELDMQLQQRERELDPSSWDSRPAAGQEADAADVAARIKGFMVQMSSMEGAEVPGAGPEDELSIEQQRFWSELGGALGFDSSQQPCGADPDSDESSSFYSERSNSDDEQDSDGAVSSSGVDNASGSTVNAQSPFKSLHAAVQGLAIDAPPRYVSHNSSSLPSHQESLHVGTEELVSDEVPQAVSSGLQNAGSSSTPAAMHASVRSGHFDQSDETDAESERGHFAEQYASILRGELQDTSMGRSFLTPDISALQGSRIAQSGGYEAVSGETSASQEADDLRPLDVDLNLVQSLLESYGAQEGLPGPAGNLAGVLGLQLQHATERNSKQTL